MSQIWLLCLCFLVATPALASGDEAIQACFDGLWDAERESPYDRVGLFSMKCLSLHAQCSSAFDEAMAMRTADRERALYIVGACRDAYCPTLPAGLGLCEADLAALPEDQFLWQWTRFEAEALRAEHPSEMGRQLADRLLQLDFPYGHQRSRYFGSRPVVGVESAEAARLCAMAGPDQDTLQLHEPAALMGYVSMRCEGLFEVPCRGATVRSPAVTDQGDQHARFLAGAAREAYCPGWVQDRPALCDMDVARADASALMRPWLELLAARLRLDGGPQAEELATLLEGLELGAPREPREGGGIIGVMPR